MLEQLGIYFLPDEAKSIILGLCKDPGKWMANLHNISAYDFIQANIHDLHLAGRY